MRTVNKTTNQEINFSAALQYVTDHGTILEQARLLRLLMGVTPSPEAYKKLVDSQNADGGFPSRPRPGSQSAVDSTLTALWQFDELGMFDSPPAGRAIQFLLDLQQPDGGWDENPRLPEHDLPPWIRPGEAATRLYLSAYAAYWLGARGMAAEPQFTRAAAYIAASQEASGRIPGYMHNNWLGAAALRFGRDGYAQKTENALAYLQSLPASEWSDSQVAWALDCLTRAGLPADHPFIHSGLGELARRQAVDGSWASEDGPAFAASATVGALKVLKHYGLLADLD